MKGSDILNQSNTSDIGSALKLILKRLNEYKDEPVEETNCKWGCLGCKNYVRKEGYNQQWGMYQFYTHYCSKGFEDKYIVHTGNADDCKSWEEGENTLIYMSDKEKRKIERR